MTATRSSELVQRLRNLHAHSGDPDTVDEAAQTLENLEGVRAERDVLQEIVDEQRAQIAKLVERIVDLTEEVSSVTEDRRHAVAALSEQVDTARAERDEANRESERLRKEAWERRNDMKPTWVTSENHEAFVKLREQVAHAEEERRHAVASLSEQVDTVRAERDEARREVCELRCNPPEPFIGLPHELAKVNGWDCFAEVTP